MRVFRLLSFGLVLSASCNIVNPTAGIVRVDDPQGIAQEATQLRIEADGKAKEMELGKATFPVTFSLTTEQAQRDVKIVVEATDDAGRIVGRGFGVLELRRGKDNTTIIELSNPCGVSEDCSDGIYCNGEELCDNAICINGEIPCPASPFSCVTVGCVEDGGVCSIGINHEACDPLEVSPGVFEAQFCDSGAGCVRGDPCYETPDCTDTSACNGVETCVALRCVPGTVPSVDDGNPCNIDACVEPQGEYHVANLQANGDSCTAAGNALGVCDNGDCNPAICSDGYTSAALGETCDDGNATPNDGCDSGCHTEAGWNCSGTPSVCVTVCGDGIQAGAEECDDNANGNNCDGCLDDCTVHVGSCGDGYTCGIEQCDDGSDNSNSSCFSCCRGNCQNQRCGDGIIDTQRSETCDDGDASSGDGCSSACQVESGFTCIGQPSSCSTTCGDQIPAGTEQCDDGNQSNCDACLTNCTTFVGVRSCGDNQVCGVETCDTGNARNDNPCIECCRTDCTQQRCGDTIVDFTEDCDDGSSGSFDGCNNCDNSEFSIDPPYSTNIIGVDVATNESSDVIMVAVTASGGVATRMFDQVGNPTSDWIQLALAGVSRARVAVVSVGPERYGVVTWDGLSGGYNIQLAAYQPDGTPLWQSQVASSGQVQRGPQVTVMSSVVQVTWTGFSDTFGFGNESLAVLTRLVDYTNGNLLGPVAETVNVTENGDQKLQALSSDYFSNSIGALYTTEYFSNPELVFARPNLSSSMTEYTIATIPLGEDPKASVATLEGSGFAVVWQTTSGASDGGDVWLRRFDSNAEPLENPIRVGGSSNLQRAPSVIAGSFAYKLFWTSTGIDGSGEAVVMRTYPPRPDDDAFFPDDQSSLSVQTAGNQRDSAAVITMNGQGIVGVWVHAPTASTQDVMMGRYNFNSQRHVGHQVGY